LSINLGPMLWFLGIFSQKNKNIVDFDSKCRFRNKS
jgi:hypothetical protein